MKKWENPELMILGVENTKEDIEKADERWLCPKCRKPHWPFKPCPPSQEFS
ncbi:Uncharacterised protein [Clostridium perfringens]|nr:hypothetical protein [Clostridium perfringens]SQB38888.1 Uncharacterised protein [Clostridium perfringens]